MKKASGCRFIAGEKPYGDRPFCERVLKEGSSYCPEHHALCYRPFNEVAAKGFTRWAAKESSRTVKYG